MKKTLMSAAVLALALASCQNEDIVSQADGMVSVKAMMGVESRTTVDGDGTVNWSQGDKMLVYGGQTQGVLTLEGNGGSDEGTFSGFVQGSVSELATALYPAEMADAKGTITLSQVTYPNSNSPMVAAWDLNGLKFSHLAGMVRLTILNVPDTRNELVVTGTGIAGTARLNGTSLTTIKAADQVKVIIPAGNGGKLTVDVPVFATVAGGEVDLTVSLNRMKYTALNETEATQVSTTLKVGALNISDMPEMEVKNNTLTDATSWSDEVEDGAELTPDAEDSYLIASAEDLAAFASMVSKGNNFAGKTVKLTDDVDLLYKEWTPISGFKGTFDGQGYTISNLKVTVEGGVSAGLFADAEGAVVKNVELEGVDIKGNYKAGAVVGDGLCARIENCHVKGGTITSTPYNQDDANNVGGIVGYLSAEPTAYVKGCSVDGLTITAYRDLGGIVGTANGKGAEVSGNTVTNTVIVADRTAEYIEVEKPNVHELVGDNSAGADLQTNTIGENVTVKIIHPVVEVDNADGLIEALESYSSVTLTMDVKIDPASMSNAYGKTGINVKNGQTIDGQGYTVDIKGAGGTWDSGINTTGGLIKNIKVTGSFRGIFVNHNSDYSEEVVLENVILDGTTYTISCDQGMSQNLSAVNSTFKGWTSYAATIGNVKFTGCYFGKGNGYAYCRPYAPTEFIDCDFEAGYEIDPRATCTFENCRLDGVLLTKDNISELVTSRKENAVVK